MPFKAWLVKSRMIFNHMTDVGFQHVFADLDKVWLDHIPHHLTKYGDIIKVKRFLCPFCRPFFQKDHFHLGMFDFFVSPIFLECHRIHERTDDDAVRWNPDKREMLPVRVEHFCNIRIHCVSIGRFWTMFDAIAIEWGWIDWKMLHGLVFHDRFLLSCAHKFENLYSNKQIIVELPAIASQTIDKFISTTCG